MVRRNQGPPFVVYPTVGGSGGGAFSANTAQFLARVADQGTARATLYSSLIDALTNTGVWAKLDFLHVYAAADAVTALVNLKSSSFNGVTTGSPTFAANQRFTTNGSSSFIDPSYTPSTAGGNLTQNSAAFGLWSRTVGQQANTSGANDATQNLTMNPRTTTDLVSFQVNQATATLSTFANTVGTGLFVGNRSGASATQAYINGVAQSVTTNANTASLGLPAVSVLTGKSAAAFNARQFAADFVSGSLTAADNLNLYVALNNYMQAIGAA